MTTILPENFPEYPEGTIASYDAMDASLGVGYKNYYFIVGTSSKFLSVMALDSTHPYTKQIPIATSPPNKVIDFDFDITYKLPQVIQGLVNINYTFGIENGGGSGIQMTNYVIVRVRKVNLASAEIELGSAQSDNLVVSPGTSYAERICGSVDVAKTHFAIGEKLRITIEQYDNYGGGGTPSAVSAMLWHDGSNRKATAYASKLYPIFTSHNSNIVVSIPYKIVL
jgi:hypothetical protein